MPTIATKKGQATPHLPPPSLYEREYDYWPWGRLVRRVADWVVSNAPQGAKMFDYMCGTGYMLRALHSRRPDLYIGGCSITPSYIEWAQAKLPSTRIVLQDALEISHPHAFDVVTATGGLHHLTPGSQSRFLQKVSCEVNQSNGWFILGEEVLRYSETEAQRCAAVNELSTALSSYANSMGAPDPIILAIQDLRQADLAQDGEFKVSQEELVQMLAPHFVIASIEHVWPMDSGAFGNVIFYCRPR